MKAVATDLEMDRALAAVAAVLNDGHVERFDVEDVQESIAAALGREPKLTLDGGGGLHDVTGLRVGALRRLPDGSWHVERQNVEAPGAGRDVPG